MSRSGRAHTVTACQERTSAPRAHGQISSYGSTHAAGFMRGRNEQNTSETQALAVRVMRNDGLEGQPSGVAHALCAHDLRSEHSAPA
jgi:hypothetical protein